MGHDQAPRAESPLASRAGRAKPAGGIFVNPADRPEGPELQAGRSRPCRIRGFRAVHSERGPGLLPPGQNMQSQSIQAMGAMRTEFAGVVTTDREAWPGV